MDLTLYDAVHIAGGRGATFDLFPSDDVANALEHFWAKEKVVGAICHGAIALGNNPKRIAGRKVTGYTLEGDKALEKMFGEGFFDSSLSTDSPRKLWRNLQQAGHK